MAYIHAEWSVIGAMLLNPTKIAEIDLRPEELSGHMHKQIYEAILELNRTNGVIDIITVSDYLQKMTGQDWLSSVAEIANKCTGSTNAVAYAESIREDYHKRTVIEIANTLSNDVEKTGKDAIDTAIRELMALNTTKKDHSCTLKQAVLSAVTEIDAVFNGETKGVKSGLEKLDDNLGGFQKTDLYIIGARPAMGKTALLLNLANSSNAPCGIVSAEQGRTQIGLRMIAINGRVPSQRLRLAKLDDEHWTGITKAVAMMSEQRTFLYDKPAPTITDVIREARKWKFQYGIEVLYVDYIQRIKATNRKVLKHEQVEEVVQGLKELARELEIPIVALAQVKRDVESRPNKRPLMSDMKDSGAIEQEADCIMTLYRDDVYHDDSPDKGIAEIAVMKNRHGPLGMVRVLWDAQHMRFHDMEPQYFRD